ncbi:MAG: helix-turn-helix domain-containing protein [Candidatus Promineifilaceae bacterium]
MNDTEQADMVMTVKEVSTYLKLAESTVYRLAQDGQLPGRKFGGAWRFSRKTLDNWFQQAKTAQYSSETA